MYLLFPARVGVVLVYLITLMIEGAVLVLLAATLE